MTTMSHELGAASDVRGPALTRSVRVMTYPVLSLLITGGWHFAVEAIWPDLRAFFVPAVLGPILLAYGAWAGYRVIGAGGGWVGAVVAGAVLGALPLMLDVVGFGILLARGTDAGLLAGMFGFSMVLFGALIGSGVALSTTDGAASSAR